MADDSINYAELYGIKSVPGAVVFAILYVPLLAWFIFHALRRPTYALIVLSLFCAVRVAAFTIRAILAGVQYAGDNLNLFIAGQVLSTVGFFSLLFSAYILVLDREKITDVSLGTGGISVLNGITGNKILFHVVMSAGVALGIVGYVQVSVTDPTKGAIFRKISVIIFLVLTVLLLYRCFLLYRREMIASREFKRSNESRGEKYGHFVLSVIAILLLTREIFVTATTMGNAEQLYNEDLWYTLVAVPELIAVILFATPDLVPARPELASVIET